MASAELVNRRMHFLHGVPHEYAWAMSDNRFATRLVRAFSA